MLYNNSNYKGYQKQEINIAISCTYSPVLYCFITSGFVRTPPVWGYRSVSPPTAEKCLVPPCWESHPLTTVPNPQYRWSLCLQDCIISRLLHKWNHATQQVTFWKSAIFIQSDVFEFHAVLNCYLDQELVPFNCWVLCQGTEVLNSVYTRSLTEGRLAYVPFGTSSNKSAREMVYRRLCGHSS